MTNYFVPTLHLIRATPVIDHSIAQNPYPLIEVANLRFYHICKVKRPTRTSSTFVYTYIYEVTLTGMYRLQR